MQNLFLIDGASGVGKSDLIKWVMENNANNVGYVRKATTRKERDYERLDPDILLDLDFMSEEEFAQQHFDYSYTYGGGRYGFRAADLTLQLLRHDNVLAIVRNTSTIQRIAADYRFINVIPVFVYTDRTELNTRLRERGIQDDVIRFRLERSEIALRDYYSHPDAYRDIVINNSARDVFHATIDRLMAKYSGAPTIDPYLFSVMMSYNPLNKKLDDYYDAIDAAIRQLSPDYRSHRVDRIPGSPKIAAEFRALAASSRCVIVDLTENKQNVYYELGFVHASGKTCVITAEEGTQLAFYPREYKVLFYGSARELRDKLHHELRGLLSNLPGV